MAFSVQQVKFEFLAYIKGLGGAFCDWYVTAGSDPEALLFKVHGVEPGRDPWIFKPMLTHRATQTLVRYFTDVLHTDGCDPAGIEEGAVFAVAFRKRRDVPVAMSTEATTGIVGEP